MKKIFQVLFLSLAALSFVACDYNNPNEGKFGNDPQSGWVNFKYENSTAITGAYTTLNVPIVINTVDIGYGPENPIVNEDGLSVYYSISGDGASLVSASGEVTFAKGEREANIEVTLPTEVLASCTTFSIDLTGTSRSNITLGFEESSVISSSYINHNVTLGLGRDAFLGTYDVEEEGVVYEVVVTAGEQADEIVVSNFADLSNVSETSFFLTGGDSSNNIRFLGYNDNFLADLGGSTGAVYASNDFSVQNEVAENTNSFYDPCTPALNFNYLLLFGAAQSSFTPDGDSINAIMTKQ